VQESRSHHDMPLILFSFGRKQCVRAAEALAAKLKLEERARERLRLRMKVVGGLADCMSCSTGCRYCTSPAHSCKCTGVLRKTAEEPQQKAGRC